MTLIHNTARRILFEKYLAEIIIDDPSIEIDNISLVSTAKEVLTAALGRAGFNTNILKIRTCENCYCKANYLKKYTNEELEKLFKP